MEQTIDYRAEILADLAFIPAEDMEAIYKIIHLIAKPHREKAEEDMKPNKKIMQAYADKFRKGFSLVMKKEVGLNFSYQVQEKFTIFKLSLASLEEQENEIVESVFDLDRLCEDKQVKIVYNEEKEKYELENLKEIEDAIEDKYSEKMIIPDGTNIHFIEVSDKSKWQPENASDDGRNLFGLFLKVGSMYQKTKQEQTI